MVAAREGGNSGKLSGLNPPSGPYFSFLARLAGPTRRCETVEQNVIIIENYNSLLR